MQYRILLDGIDIFDPRYPAMAVTEAKVVQDLSSSGSLDFTLPPDHVFYDSVRPMLSTINVLESNGEGSWKSVFYGRPLEPQKDFLNRKHCHCEGALSWLQDIRLPKAMQPNPGTPKDTSTYVTEIVDYYNNKVPADRRFVLSVLPPSGTNIIVREWEYQNCKEALSAEAGAIGGVLFARRNNTDNENGIRLTKLLPYVSAMEALDQPISLGLNIIDIQQTAQDIVTACIGTGAEGVEMITPVTLQSMVDKYGLIEAYQNFPDCTTIQQLEAACLEWLEEQVVGGVSVEVSALDLHILEPGTYARLEVARKVRFNGSPWGLGDRYAPITRVEIDILTGRKKIRLGFSSAASMPLTKKISRTG